MKYLNNREEFLKRSIAKINEYKSLEDTEVYKINESENSGPFANDIPWGDSLLGRLINSTIRKAKIGANLVIIKGVIRRLKYAFDDLLGGSIKAGLSEEDQKELNKIMIFSFIENLEKAVKEGARVGDIKNLTKSAISDIKAYEDIDNKDILIKQLEDFLKFLEQFKDDEGGKSELDTEEGEGKKGEGKEGEGKEGSESGTKTLESLYPVMVKNLKSLGLILSNYKNVKIVGSTSKDEYSMNKKYSSYTTKNGDTINKIISNTEVNTKKITADVLRQKNQKVLAVYKNDQPLKAGLLLVMEKNMIFEGIPGISNQPGGGVDRGNIRSGEDHLTQAFTKLKKDIEVLISAKEKGIGIDTNFIKEITSNAVDTNTKNQIKALYFEINRYLVGDKKSTIQEKEPLYKESLQIISDKNKRIVVAEKMARFTKRALQFDKEGLYGGLGDLNKPLQDYVETIKQIMQASSEPKKEVKKESLLARYDRFILINEAEENEKPSEENKDDKKEGVGEPEVSTTSQKIIDYWNKNIDVKAFVVDKTEVIKMKEKIDELSEKNKNSIVINGLDPILDIVKCFNRAYKIHTTQVIPSGRSGGRVSNKTFMEYTCFGSGDPSNAGSGGGPYRNNAIFNQWENAVQDIIRDTKYQKVFRDETTLKTSEGNIIEKAGSNLRKFMTDMLDGDELYKTGKDGQGMQAKFLDKYFGYKDADSKKTNFDPSDEKENSENANSIETVNLQFTKNPIKFESNDSLAKSFFAATTKDGKVIYFFIQEVVGDTAYIVYSRTFYFFDKYISESGVSNKLNKGDLPRLNKDKITEAKDGSQDYKIKATKKKIENLIGKDGSFKLKGAYEVTYLTKYEGKKNNPNTKSTLSDKPEVLNISECYTLGQVEKEGENKRFILDKKIVDRISLIGGFMKVSTSDNISKTEIKKL
jgi:hypothetical protein